MNQAETIYYDCDLCGIEHRGLPMPARDPGEDIVHFLETKIAPMVKRDHDSTSPFCNADSVSRLEIPLSDETVH